MCEQHSNVSSEEARDRDKEWSEGAHDTMFEEHQRQSYSQATSLLGVAPCNNSCAVSVRYAFTGLCRGGGGLRCGTRAGVAPWCVNVEGRVRLKFAEQGGLDQIGPLRVHDIILELQQLMQEDARNCGGVQRCPQARQVDQIANVGHVEEVT